MMLQDSTGQIGCAVVGGGGVEEMETVWSNVKKIPKDFEKSTFR